MMQDMKNLERIHQLTNAILYALNQEADGIIWLREWNEGDTTAMAELDRYIASKGL